MALTDNIISYWKLNGNATDELGVNNGTANSVSWVAGKIGDCADFAGTSGSDIQLSTTSSLTNNLTFSFWYYHSSTARQGLYAKTDGSGNSSSSWVFEVNSSNIYFTLYSGSSAYSTVTTTTLSTNTWYFITGTYDGSTVKVYLNATLEGSASMSVNINNITQTTVLGQFGSYTGLPCSGYIDEVGSWSRALSSTEITELYNGGTGLTYPFSAPASSPTAGFFAGYLSQQ